MTTISPAQLSDRDLIAALARAASAERRATAELVALLAEVDERRLYLGEGCSSLFTYCTQVLHLSEHAAYHRIEVARAARQFPILLEQLAEGAVTLTTVTLLRPHLTSENHRQLLDGARHKSKREVEHQVACLAPKPEPKPALRRVAPPPSAIRMVATNADHPLLSEPTVESPSLRPADSRVDPIAPERYVLKVTLNASAYKNLRRAQDLMRHSNPNGDPSAVIEKALSLLVEHLERTKAATTRRPARGAVRRRPGGRHIPAAVRREVWARDEGRCAFEGAYGRCTETGRLEFHHVIPFAEGGTTSADDLSLRCRSHNQHESEKWFGPLSSQDP